jgi:hypothetical protein
MDNVVVLNISRNKLTLLEALPPQLQVLNVSKVCGVARKQNYVFLGASAGP